MWRGDHFLHTMTIARSSTHTSAITSGTINVMLSVVDAHHPQVTILMGSAAGEVG